jgi:hypothetical protein
MAAGMVVFAVLASGCSGASEKPSLQATDPRAQTKAVERAVATNDRKAIPGLIAMLDSVDPAERMVAIGALRRMTGQDFGYDPTDPPWLRSKAVDRWQEWW